MTKEQERAELHRVIWQIAHGDPLLEPKHWDDEPFDAIVSNSPYPTKWDGGDNPAII